MATSSFPVQAGQVKETPASMMAQVFPSGVLVPENLLRFHLRFAKPVYFAKQQCSVT
jgi:hypothetical protein